MAKDLFSGHAADYAKFRPSYPAELIEYIVSLVPNRQTAWDCATGNGQAAVLLSPFFEKIFATDISQEQVRAAQNRLNITYSVSTEHSTSFDDGSFDLITVAQAYHWFDHQQFIEEASRVAKPEAIIALWGYNVFRCSNLEVSKMVDDFYLNVTDPYWEPERKYLENNYRDLPIPFQELTIDHTFKMTTHWTIEQMEGYLNTWSAIKKFIRVNNFNPVDELINKIRPVWGDEKTHEFKFPLALRVSKKI